MDDIGWVPEWAEWFTIERTARGLEIKFVQIMPGGESYHHIDDLPAMLSRSDVGQQIRDKPLADRIDTTTEPVDKVFMGGERTKYHRAIGVVGCECGKRTRVWADVYDVLGAFTGHYTARVKPIVDHLLKKLLAGGERGHKDLRQDMVDVHDSAKRAIDTIDEWA
jgi:hypothetical protein